MGFGTRVFFVILSLVAAVLYQNYKNISRPLPVPTLDVNAYWGPGSKSSYKEDPSIKPFTLNYADAAADLKQQLSRPLKLHEPLEGVGFEYGFNSKALEKIIGYWRDNYLPRWADREKFLNKFPHFTTQIQGLNVHFLRVKPANPGSKKVVPLLLLHGWPGSIREFYEFIPFVTNPSMEHDYVFEVVVPSLVGFGWSQASAKKHYGPAEMSIVFRNLMLRLGHERFLIQGGDWGSVVGSNLATFFPENTIGLDIHFLRVKPTNSGSKKVIPLLLLHGWPGSIREFYEFIPLLTKPSKEHDYVFEVIAPSLVGYGWSQASAKKNFGPAEMSIVFRNLMLRLGHQKFIIQGGDWGSIIGGNLATFFPENTIGYHTNMCFSNSLLSNIKLLISTLYPSYFYEKHQEEFHLPAGEKFLYLIEESGYFHLQATKPDTIGTALLNNPVGLAAYILEKFSTWTNVAYRKLPDGGLDKRFTLDALLDNIMIYYLTNSITTSQRLYAEQYAKQQRDLQLERVQTTVPVGCARFRQDLAAASDWQLQEKYTNLVHSTYHKDGGHFAALELPKVLYTDFIEFVKKVVV